MKVRYGRFFHLLVLLAAVRLSFALAPRNVQGSLKGQVNATTDTSNSLEMVPAKRHGKRVILKLDSLQNESDADAFRDLTGIELTQRMSTQQLERWKALMPGEQSRKALAAVADVSTFLKLPEVELPKSAPLDKAAQQQLLQRMNRYVEQTMARLPNFFANQRVTTFEAIHGLRDSSRAVVQRPLQYIGQITTSVRYHNGKELMATGKGDIKESDQVGYKLLFSGQFGPVLNTVLADAEQNKISFSHWEPAIAGQSSFTTPLAVFRYSVSRRKSHCTIKVVMPGSTFPTEATPAYHGELVVDPATGAILRLTLIADLTSDDPMSVANLMVEYGPVELGGKVYICPVRSVTLETIVQSNFNHEVAVVQSGGMDRAPSHDSNMVYAPSGDVPSATFLNDVAFEDFQVLRSDSRIIFNPDTETPRN